MRETLAWTVHECVARSINWKTGDTMPQVKTFYGHPDASASVFRTEQDCTWIYRSARHSTVKTVVYTEIEIVWH